MTERGDSPPLVSAQMVGSLRMGGAEHLAVQIANARAADGDRSHLYVLDGPGPLSAKISPDVIVRHFEQQVAPPTRPWRCYASIRTGYRQLMDSLTADGIDVLQTHLPGANFWGLLLSVAGRRTVIPTVHSNREFDYGEAVSLPRAQGRRWAYRRMLSRCAAVVAVSENVRKALLAELGLRGRSPERLVVVPNGVPIPEPLPAAERADVRARYDCAPDDFLVLAAGRHCALKNYEALIDVIGLLRARDRAVRLVLAGEGPLTVDYRERADSLGLGDRVCLPGNLDDLPRVMQAADGFVISSRWEGLSLVMLEAMACGLPVVGTRIPGVEDLIDDGVSGLLAVPDDVADLARAVTDLIDDPALRDSCRIAAREQVVRDFSIDRVSRDLGELYWSTLTRDRTQ
jgi:L-malate glycosyltransferase